MSFPPLRTRCVALAARRWLSATLASGAVIATLCDHASRPAMAEPPEANPAAVNPAAVNPAVANPAVANPMAGDGFAASTREPRPVPLTRPEMKQRLEEIKHRAPRIPLPEITDAERAALAERGVNYENRLRYHYLPPLPATLAGSWRWSGSGFAGGSRDADPDMRLDYAFKTRLFWIVSRTNNCQYCLGHQESKLLAAGMAEDQIAALDSDWTLFPAREQAAFAYSRKLTFAPHLLTDADFEALAPHFTPLEILEMTLSIAGNNAINRWKEGAGVPQSSDGGNFGRTGPNSPVGAAATKTPAVATAPATADAHHSYLTPTSAKYAAQLSRVAPISKDSRTGAPTTRAVFTREAPATRAVIESALRAASTREARLPLTNEQAARGVWPPDAPTDSMPLPGWVRLLANFPQSAPNRIRSVQLLEFGGDLPPLLKAKTAWVLARQDRAWYALGQARDALRRKGISDDEIYAMDETATPLERSLFRVARHLAASPVVLTDDEVADAVQLSGPRIVTQFIQYVTHRASFQRVTEAAGLPLEPSWPR
ncbi:MAG: carboxymuconolactone decarboxylase family protein [Planctomycetota bacterium]